MTRASNRVLYLYWGSHEQFKTILYPIAELANQKYAEEAIIATVKTDTFHSVIEPQSWLRVHHYDPIVLKKKYQLHNKLLTKLIGFLKYEVRIKRYWLEQARNLIDIYNPRAIIVRAAFCREVPFVMKLARKRGIPTFFIGQINVTFGFKQLSKLKKRNQYSDTSSSLEGKHYREKFKIFVYSLLHKYLEKCLYLSMGIYKSNENSPHVYFTDYHLLPNQKYKHELIRLGGYPKKLVVLGLSEEDRLHQLQNDFSCSELRRQYFQDLGLDDNKRVVLFALENFPALSGELSPSDVQDIINATISTVLSFSEVQLIVKIHPRDNPQNYSWIKERYPAVRLVTEIDILMSVMIADIVIVHGSTVVNFAMLARKPTIIVNFKNYWLCKSVAEGYAAACMVGTPRELRLKVEGALATDCEFLEEEYGSPERRLDGNVTKNILTFVQEVSRHI